jgi:myo-inositol 2-dehydrogenase/D-chiro-inositol 1-dehydrogenase
VSEHVLRLGLVGLGDIAVRAHLPAIAANPETELVAVAEVDPARLRAAAPSSVRTTADPEELFADPEIDAVVIATPAATTVELVRAALQAGKYVLAEKPIAPTAAAAASLGEVAGARDRLQIGLTYRHHPAIDRLRELIAAGELGRPLLIQAAICDERADPEGDPRGYARRLRSLERMAPMISDGVHACDRVNLLLGVPPAVVSGWSLTTDASYPSPNINGGVLTYDDGTVVRLEVIWLTPVLPPSQFIVTGPLGCATLDPPTFCLTIELADGHVERLDPPGDKTQVCFALQLERFVSSCTSRTAPVPGFDEALASLTLAERIADAAGAGAGVLA